jgi:hypothetical protein
MKVLKKEQGARVDSHEQVNIRGRSKALDSGKTLPEKARILNPGWPDFHLTEGLPEEKVPCCPTE